MWGESPSGWSSHSSRQRSRSWQAVPWNQEPSTTARMGTRTSELSWKFATRRSKSEAFTSPRRCCIHSWAPHRTDPGREASQHRATMAATLSNSCCRIRGCSGRRFRPAKYRRVDCRKSSWLACSTAAWESLAARYCSAATTSTGLRAGTAGSFPSPPSPGSPALGGSAAPSSWYRLCCRALWKNSRRCASGACSMPCSTGGRLSELISTSLDCIPLRCSPDRPSSTTAARPTRT
mmetsp:Transcript_23543/g.66938  ORF Transcript_23543/g.66938 Transcript_23543/m.66938 type:complete len:235 (+) Transcript_23543:1217-1921(+)